MWTRFQPIIAKLQKALFEDKVIGEIRGVNGTFAMNHDNSVSRRLRPLYRAHYFSTFGSSSAGSFRCRWCSSRPWSLQYLTHDTRLVSQPRQREIATSSDTGYDDMWTDWRRPYYVCHHDFSQDQGFRSRYGQLRDALSQGSEVYN